jgi:hypothetical protein
MTELHQHQQQSPKSSMLTNRTKEEQDSWSVATKKQFNANINTHLKHLIQPLCKPKNYSWEEEEKQKENIDNG